VFTVEAALSFRISGKHLDVGEALRGRIEERIAGALSKYFDGGYSGHAILEREGSGFRTECALHLDSKVTLRAEGNAPDPYESADQAVLHVEKKLRRYHRRLKDHRPRTARGDPLEQS
jgi:putative sigma-54 modulation protein